MINASNEDRVKMMGLLSQTLKMGEVLNDYSRGSVNGVSLMLSNLFPSEWKPLFVPHERKELEAQMKSFINPKGETHA